MDAVHTWESSLVDKTKIRVGVIPEHPHANSGKLTLFYRWLAL